MHWAKEPRVNVSLGSLLGRVAGGDSPRRDSSLVTLESLSAREVDTPDLPMQARSPGPGDTVPCAESES